VSAAELPAALVVALDFVAWLAIHLGAAWVGTNLPSSVFADDSWLYRTRSWERDGELYVRVFRVGLWKRLLPDGAAIIRRGFPKRYLRDRSDVYLEDFRRETRRAELTHYLAMLPAPVFFVWNPWPVGIFMLAYAAATNLPCVVTQRYNRLRLGRVLARRYSRQHRTERCG